MLRDMLLFVISFLIIFSEILSAVTVSKVPLIVNRVELSYIDLHSGHNEKVVSTAFLVHKKKDSDRMIVSMYRYDAKGALQLPTKEGTIPVVKSYFFTPGDKIYVSLTASLFEFLRGAPKRYRLTVRTARDKESFFLYPVAKGSRIYTGVLETTNDLKYADAEDGKLYVRDTDTITLYKEAKSRTLQKLAEAKVSSALSAFQKSTRAPSLWLSVANSRVMLKRGMYAKETITVTNNTAESIENAKLVLHAPRAVFLKSAYLLQKGASRLGIEQTAQGYRLGLPLLQPKASLKIELVTTLFTIQNRKSYTVSAELSSGERIRSNRAVFTLHLQENHQFETQKGFIVGKISGQESAGITVLLSNGQAAVTDREGRYHFENLDAGTYVVTIDPETLHEGTKALVCRQSVYSGKSAESLFAEVRPGLATRADFCLKNSDKKGKKDQRTKGQKERKYGKTTPTMPRLQNSDTLRYQDRKYAWIWPPKEGFVPSIGSIKVAIYYPKTQKMKLFINGNEVDALNRDAILKNPRAKGVIATFRGIDLQPGDNLLKAIFYDAKGETVSVMKRLVHYSTAPAFAVYLPELSRPVANGKDYPVIAIKLKDKNGYPLRESMTGTVYVDPPYRIRSDTLGRVERDRNPKYLVTYGGIAYIELEPTATAGDVRVHIPLIDHEEVLRVRLRPSNRRWVLVGFAEGTVGFQKIKDAMRKTAKKDAFYQKGRVAFYAAGTIRGDTLLQIAYDSGKKDTGQLAGQIDPNTWYTIYQDESFQTDRAPSRRKLYIKLEKREFSLLFGNFNTGIDTVELSRYTRKVNGFKAVLHHQKSRLTLFASDDDTAFEKEILDPDGTSGLYRLKHQQIVENSETVALVVRDRNRPDQVLSRRLLTPVLDYTIDYTEGTLYFKEPVFRVDEAGNPRYIEVDYEVLGTRAKKVTLYGARALWKEKTGRLQTGATYLHETKGSLVGADAKMRIGRHLQIEGEYAKSRTSDQKAANASRIRAVWSDQKAAATLYWRRSSPGFGLGQQTRFTQNSSDIGIDATLKYGENYRVKAGAYHRKRFDTKNAYDMIECKNSLVRQNSEGYVGYRFYRSEEGSGSQFLGGYTRKFFANRLRTALSVEYGPKPKSAQFANRLHLHTTYAVNRKSDLFATMEYRSTKRDKRINTAAGMTYRPWRNATLKSSLASEFANNQPSLWQTLLFNQGFALGKSITLNGSIEHRSALSGTPDKETYTAYNMIVNYRKGKWALALKCGYKDANISRTGIDFDLYTERKNRNLGLLFGIRAQRENHPGMHTFEVASRLALAYRSQEGTLLLGRMQYRQNRRLQDRQKTWNLSSLLTMSLSERIDLSLRYALQFSRTWFALESFDTLAQIAGADLVWYIGKKFDVGVHAAYMYDFTQKSDAYQGGIYGGYRLLDEGWLTLGYNFEGFARFDDLFADYLRQGIYLTFRMKYDHASMEKITRMVR